MGKKEREKKIRPTQKIKYIPNNFFCDNPCLGFTPNSKFYNMKQ